MYVHPYLYFVNTTVASPTIVSKWSQDNYLFNVSCGYCRCHFCRARDYVLSLRVKTIPCGSITGSPKAIRRVLLYSCHAFESSSKTFTHRGSKQRVEPPWGILPDLFMETKSPTTHTSFECRVVWSLSASFVSSWQYWRPDKIWKRDPDHYNQYRIRIVTFFFYLTVADSCTLVYQIAHFCMSHFPFWYLSSFNQRIKGLFFFLIVLAKRFQSFWTKCRFFCPPCPIFLHSFLQFLFWI